MSDPKPATSIPGTGEILTFFRCHYTFNEVLDIGCGKGWLWPVLKDKAVTAIGLAPRKAVKIPSNVRYIEENFFFWKRDRLYEAAFCSHMVEHIQDTARFLTRFFDCIPENKPWCLIWPPPKPQIVPGHVHVFSLGMMLYNLVSMGIDCANVKMLRCKYSLGLMGIKKRFVFPSPKDGHVALDELTDRFPFKAYNSFNGDNPPRVIEL